MSNIPSETVPPTQQNPTRTPRMPTVPTDGDTMERLFQALFYRIAILYARAVPKHIRRLGETALLVLAILCLTVLVYLHLVFNKRPVTCLSHLQNNWPKQGILRVELFFEPPPDGYNLRQSYAKEFQYGQLYQNGENQHNYDGSEIKNIYPTLPVVEINIDQSEEEPHYFNTTIESELLSLLDKTLQSHDYDVPSSKLTTANQTDENQQNNEEHLEQQQTSAPNEDSQNKETIFNLFYSNIFDTNWLKQLLVEEQHILEYSLEYGFLRLSPETRQRLKIEVLLVTIDISNNTCFGNGFSRFLVDQFLGYQDLLMSSIKQLAEKETHKGYVRNVISNDHFRFVSTWQNRRWWTYLVALCVMVVFTISISMLLRYSHFQIFLFIVDLLRMIEHNAPIIFPAAPLLTVILALIGMEAIMSEFFNDASTAFYIILIVWMSDQYDSICCHTNISKKHWVRFFYIYHFAFYAYHARYNGQYSGLALTTSCCFILHSMFYFFHHFELPIIEAQLNILVDHNITSESDSPTSSTSATSNSETTEREEPRAEETSS